METVRPTPDLDYLGLGSGPEVRSNLDASTLLSMAMTRKEGILSAHGVLVTETGARTGRSRMTSSSWTNPASMRM